MSEAELQANIVARRRKVCATGHSWRRLFGIGRGTHVECRYCRIRWSATFPRSVGETGEGLK